MVEKVESRLTDSLDFPKILFKQVSLILDARNSGDTDSYIRNVEGLDHLMFYFWDDDYKKNVNNVGEMFKANMGKIPNPGGEREKVMRLQAKYNYAQGIFKALMSLVGRCGFLPFREFTVIID